MECRLIEWKQDEAVADISVRTDSFDDEQYRIQDGRHRHKAEAIECWVGSRLRKDIQRRVAKGSRWRIRVVIGGVMIQVEWGHR
jgi:hypothetical protein